MLKGLILVLSLVGAQLGTAHGDTLTAGQAKTAALSDGYANIYYTVMKGTYRVVITVAPGSEEGGRPMRFVSGLADGESQEISVGGFGKNTLLTTLTVSRTSDEVSFNVGTRNVSGRRKITNSAD